MNNSYVSVVHARLPVNGEDNGGKKCNEGCLG